jgi:hypothetical protein
MNVETETEDAQFPENEYINGIFLAVQEGTETSFYSSRGQWARQAIPDQIFLKHLIIFGLSFLILLSTC